MMKTTREQTNFVADEVTIESGDHSFKVSKRSGRTSGVVMAELRDAITAWAKHVTT